MQTRNAIESLHTFREYTQSRNSNNNNNNFIDPYTWTKKIEK